MFGMGMWEILLVVLLVLVVMGPEKIPEAAKMFGKAVREVRKMSNLLRDAVDIDIDDEPARPRPAMQQNKSYGAVEDYNPEPVAKYEQEEIYEIFSVEMNSPIPAENLEVELVPPVEPELHREVYLHIPFEETI